MSSPCVCPPACWNRSGAGGTAGTALWGERMGLWAAFLSVFATEYPAQPLGNQSVCDPVCPLSVLVRDRMDLKTGKRSATIFFFTLYTYATARLFIPVFVLRDLCGWNGGAGHLNRNWLISGNFFCF